MCEPTSIVAGVGLGISAISGLIGYSEQQEAHDKAVEAAKESARQQTKLLTLRQMQEAEAGKQSIFFADMDARRADAQARVSAGESGVAGASVDILLDDIERQKLLASEGIKKNTQGRLDQLEQEKQGVKANMQNQINSVPEPNPWATGLQILGGAADAAGTYYRNKPTTGGK